jgi:hypothetical protein
MLDLVGYIDAGTGSYLLAAIASGAAGTWFFIRSNIAKLRGRKLEDAPEQTDQVEASDAVEPTATAESRPSSTDA